MEFWIKLELSTVNLNTKTWFFLYNVRIGRLSIKARDYLKPYQAMLTRIHVCIRGMFASGKLY